MRIVIPVLLATACGSQSGGGDDMPAGDAAVDGSGTSLTLPPVNAKVDYQLGAAYAPPAGVTIVTRQRKMARIEGLYNICYLNGFQTQPEEERYWLDLHPDLLLRDSQGNPVIDPERNEMLLDIVLAEKRAAISSIVNSWIMTCRAGGYDAIEIDNADSYTRSQGRLYEQHAVYTMKLIADHAHAAGMPIAQKNAAQLVARKAELGTDFAIAEECNRYNNCDMYTAGYGDHVILIEHRQQDFNASCLAHPNLSIVLRDPSYVAPSGAGYLYDDC